MNVDPGEEGSAPRGTQPGPESTPPRSPRLRVRRDSAALREPSALRVTEEGGRSRGGRGGTPSPLDTPWTPSYVAGPPRKGEIGSPGGSHDSRQGIPYGADQERSGPGPRRLRKDHAGGRAVLRGGVLAPARE